MSNDPLCDRCGAPTDDHVLNMGGCIDFLRRERDKLRLEVERAEAKTAAEYEAHKLTKCERDALRAEFEKLIAACKGVPSLLRQADAHLRGKVAGTVVLESAADAIDAAMKGGAK